MVKGRKAGIVANINFAIVGSIGSGVVSCQAIRELLINMFGLIKGRNLRGLQNDGHWSEGN